MADVINIVPVYCEGQEIHCRQSMYDGTPENGTCATLTVVHPTYPLFIYIYVHSLTTGALL